MATLDYTGDGGTKAPNMFNTKSRRVDLYRRLTVSDIIASDTTMTSNGYITANDIIQCLDVPIGFRFEGCIFRVITPTTNACNVEVGVAGGAEALASMDLDGSAGDATSTVETDNWAGGKIFTAADTIDCQFITANATDGDFELFVWGTQIQLGT